MSTQVSVWKTHKDAAGLYPYVYAITITVICSEQYYNLRLYPRKCCNTAVGTTDIDNIPGFVCHLMTYTQDVMEKIKNNISDQIPQYRFCCDIVGLTVCAFIKYLHKDIWSVIISPDVTTHRWTAMTWHHCNAAFKTRKRHRTNSDRVWELTSWHQYQFYFN